ncbi:hypothetical protein ACFE04_023295 [Oxalis oulophora]
MSHRKVHSHGSIPFSWEHKPGVSKDCVTDTKLAALLLASTSTDTSNANKPLADHVKIPLKLPPRKFMPPQATPRGSMSSLKDSGLGMRWWQDDPFFAAYKKCTKVEDDNVKFGSSGQMKRKPVFSCKNSCEVRNDNLARRIPLFRKKEHRGC